MALHEITYSCGCVLTRQLYGPIAQRERYIAWAATDGECGDCRKVDALDNAGAVEAEHGLPDLFGSSKQIEWARQARAKLVPAVLEYFESKRSAVPADKIDLFEGQVSRVIVGLCGHRSASWWIDRRDRSAGVVATEVFAEARR